MPYYQPTTYTARRHISLTSLTHQELLLVLSFFAPLWKSYHQHYDLQGNRRKIPKFTEASDISLKGEADKLFFALVYLKSNPLQEHHGHLFDMSQGKVSQWITMLLPLVREALSRMKLLPKRCADELYAVLACCSSNILFIDATERRVPRSCDYEVQKDQYSGKKGCHTIKNNLITDSNTQILFLSRTCEGRVHDKKIADESACYFPEETVLYLDLGYQGFKAQNVTICIPFKKPKGKKLNGCQRIMNHLISKIRVTVEHVMAGVKRLRITKDLIRLKTERVRDMVMEVACALHNLRVTQRKLT